MEIREILECQRINKLEGKSEKYSFEKKILEKKEMREKILV